MQQDSVLVCYKGITSNGLLDGLLDLSEKRLSNHSLPGSIKRKAFAVMVEMLQNVLHHAPNLEEEAGETLIVFTLQVYPEGIHVTTGNYLPVAEAPKLRQQLDALNGMDAATRKETYRKALNEGFTEKGGGGLGLIDIARRTGQQLDYTFGVEQHSQQVFFTLNVFIPA